MMPKLNEKAELRDHGACFACGQSGFTVRGLKAHKGTKACLRRWMKRLEQWEMKPCY